MTLAGLVSQSELGAAVAARPPCMGAERSQWTFFFLVSRYWLRRSLFALFAVAIFHFTHALRTVICDTYNSAICPINDHVNLDVSRGFDTDCRRSLARQPSDELGSEYR